MSFWQTLQVVAPVFILPFIGALLKRIRLIDASFVTMSSRLVFIVALPCLVFVKLSVVNLSRLLRPGLILYIYAATITVFFLVWMLACFWIHRGDDLGAFVQGSYRGNFAIVGFAIILNLFGESGLTRAAVILAFIMPLYNVLAVIVLTITNHQKKLPLRILLFRIMTNPLMISVLIAVIFSLCSWRLHPVIFNAAEILSRLALPLALLGIGGSLNLEAIRSASKMAVSASFLKLVLLPVAMTYGAICMGFSGQELGILFVLFGCPTAVSSYVMADAMGANDKLAGNIILISTLGAAFSITAGIVILKKLGFI
ncbi:AEC family transporter [bacterium]|nr:AEC family transporter [bacterium]